MGPTAVAGAVVVIPEYVAAVLTLFGVAAAVSMVVIHWRHGLLTRRVEIIERAGTARLEKIEGTLEAIQADGRANRDLLHLIIKGHMPGG